MKSPSIWRLYFTRIFRIRFREPTTRGISLINLCGFILGAFAIMIVLATMNGFYESIHKAVSALAGDISVLAYDPLPLKKRLEVEKVLYEKYGSNVMTFDTLPVLIQAKGRHADALLEAYGSGLTPWKPNLDSEKLCGKSPFVILGKPIQERLGVQTGDSVQVTLLQSNQLKTISFMICNVASVGFYEYDQKLIWTKREFIQVHQAEFPMGAKILQPTVSLKGLQKESQLLKAQLGRGFYTFTWFDRHQNLFEAIKTERKMVLWVIAFIVLVASFNLVSHLYVHYKTRAQAFQLLYVLGERRIRLIGLALVQGGWIGVLGSTLGVMLSGIVIALATGPFKIRIPMEIYNLRTLPLQFQWEAGFWIIGLSGLLAMVVSIIPAFQTQVLFQASSLQE
jgi:lipoprotein-releasing system permease protein